MSGPSRVVVITGASAGIGRAIARAYAARGARIGLLARGRDGLEAARRDVEAAGGVALVVPTDVAHADEVELAAEAVEEELGPIDVWINNAMVSVFSPVTETTAAEFKRVTEVTYLGYVYGTLAALKRMRPRDRGVIVQVGSALAYRGIPLQAAYCGAKHATQGFMDSLRCELIHDGSRVRVTMVQMPAVNTPQFDWVKTRLPGAPQPVPPIFQPEVAAEAVLWAAEPTDRSSTSAPPPCSPSSATRSRRAWATGSWPAPATPRSRPRSRSIRRVSTICGRPSRAIMAPTAASIAGRTGAASSSGSPCAGAPSP